MILFYQLEIHSKRLSASPWVIATELFLKHKNLTWNQKLLKFTQVGNTIRSITNGEWSKVPTLVFPNGDVKFDSFKIAEYLDNNYSNSPLNPNNLELDQLIEYYDNNCYKTSFKMCMLDIFNSLDDVNKKYFRDTKEPNFKAKVEDYQGDRGENIETYIKTIKPIVKHLESNMFLDGNEPLIHDYCLMGRIQMMKTISPQSYKELVEKNPSEAFKNWAESMSSLFDGYLKSRKTVLSD